MTGAERARALGTAVAVVLVAVVGAGALAIGVIALVWRLHDPRKPTPQQLARQQHQNLCVLGLYVDTAGKPATKVLDESRWDVGYAQANSRFGLPDWHNTPPDEREDVIIVQTAILRLAEREVVTANEMDMAEAAAGRIDAWVAAHCPAASTSTTRAPTVTTGG